MTAQLTKNRTRPLTRAQAITLLQQFMCEEQDAKEAVRLARKSPHAVLKLSAYFEIHYNPSVTGYIIQLAS